MALKINSNWWEQEGDGLAYKTSRGKAYQMKVEDFLKSKESSSIRGKVDLIITSPPFPLLAPKKYGNSTGDEYKNWISSLAKPLADLLSPTGSIVIEIGNVWERGEPLMSTLPIETLIEFGREGDLKLCQQFVCHNPARLPSPAPWVTVRRIRLKDSYTHVWWFSKTPFPKSDNRKVLQPYSPAMEKLLQRGTYNPGTRPSEHNVSETGFLQDNGGSISSSMLSFSNTASPKNYREWCSEHGVQPHPARMQSALVEHFIKFLTDEHDIVFDPFGGSNTSGWVAENLNRKWVISEPNTDYLTGSIGRFQSP